MGNSDRPTPVLTTTLQRDRFLEDAAQEAFIEAYLNLSKLRSPVAFPGWLKKIIFKHCDRLTRCKRLAIEALSDTDELVSIHPEPTQIALENEVKDIVNRSIQTLPESDRTTEENYQFCER